MNTIVNVNLFSPIRGCEVVCSVELNEDFMEIKMKPRKSKVTWQCGSDPEWTGEAFNKIFTDVSIFPSVLTQGAFEYLWKEWRDGIINDKKANEELQKLAGWINAGTRAQPKSDFWNACF